jgi:enoyl-CoA hydratase/carnithine racemase
LVRTIILLFKLQHEMSNALQVERIAGNFVFRFNRPEIRSPLSVNVLRQIAIHLRKIKGDAFVRAVIFTGRDGVFASGADLSEINQLTGNHAREFAIRGQAVMNDIADLKQPTIAAIAGYCYGGALDLALACQFRIASSEATFAHPGSRLGIITGWGGTQRLPRLIGQARALEMFLTADAVGAESALGWGLIDRIESDPLAFALGTTDIRRAVKAI